MTMVAPPDPETIRRLLDPYRAELRAAGVRALAVFGSTARGEARDDSDVDLLVDLDPAARVGLLGYIALERRLGELIGRKVDLCTREGLHRLARGGAEADARPVFQD